MIQARKYAEIGISYVINDCEFGLTRGRSGETSNPTARDVHENCDLYPPGKTSNTTTVVVKAST